MNVLDADKIKKCRDEGDCGFHSPGKQTGHPGFSGNLGKTCADVISRTLADVGTESYLTDLMTPCKKGWSKIAVVVDPKRDFHYLRQDSNGLWSQKSGAREVTDRDAAGAKIVNPENAYRYYARKGPSDTELNYSEFCGLMCVPRKNPPILSGGKSNLK